MKTGCVILGTILAAMLLLTKMPPRDMKIRAVSGGRAIDADEHLQGLIADFGFAVEPGARDERRRIGCRTYFIA